MAFKEDHNLFVGGKYGSFKGLHCCFDKVLSKNLQNVQFINAQSHITVMKWGDAEERELLLATANQTVKVYDTEYKSYVESIPAKCGQGPIVGVTRYNGALVTAVESGAIRVWRPRNSNEIVLDPEDLDLQLSGEDDGKFEADINGGGNLSCMQHSPFNKHIIGCGGDGNDLKLWDLKTKQRIFSAKNLPDDAVRLAEPIWVSDMAFLAEKNAVAVCSRYGYVRLYDSKTQRKPVWALKVPEQALTCLAVSNEVNLVCGMAKGDMLMVDLRMRKLVHKYKGFLGAVRGIACHPTAPYIASVSLDRHVRIHHRDTKELLVKEYLKLPLHCLVMRSDAVFTDDGESSRKSQKRKPDAEDAELQEYDDILNSLEKVEEKPNKKIKKQERSKPVLLINPFASSKAVIKASEKNGLKKNNSSGGSNSDKNDSDDDDDNDTEEEDDEDNEEDGVEEEEEDLDEDENSEDEMSDKDEEDDDDENQEEGSDDMGDSDDDSDCLIVE